MTDGIRELKRKIEAIEKGALPPEEVVTQIEEAGRLAREAADTLEAD